MRAKRGGTTSKQNKNFEVIKTFFVVANQKGFFFLGPANKNLGLLL